MNRETLEVLVHRMNSSKLAERRRIGREILAAFDVLSEAGRIKEQDVAYWHSRAEERLKEIARLEEVVRTLSVRGAPSDGGAER